MFNTQRDLVVYIHHALMKPHDETEFSEALYNALVVYAFENEVDAWIEEAMRAVGYAD